ncbi:MAG: aspartate kinase [Gammaproteobacteria bacterium]|nr:aspartate kinase [Gammaproteobacteria bacterium]
MKRVLKFGGSSVATADRMRQVATIINQYAEQDELVIVVSALRGVTDQLIECAKLASANKTQYHALVKMIATRHHNLLNELLDSKVTPEALNNLDSLLQELEKILDSISILHDNHAHACDLVVSFGERLSAGIFATFLNTQRPACYVDARQFIKTDHHFTKAQVLFEESEIAIQHYFSALFKQQPDIIPIVTGFIGLTDDHQVTTLGRDGSNYTAEIIAAALNVAEIHIFSDVSGVHSANPKLIDNTIKQPRLSYDEAREISLYDGKVLNALLKPEVIEKQIPIWVKNTLNPVDQGTLISSYTEKKTIKNVSLMHDLVFISLSSKQVCMKDITKRLFNILQAAEVHYIFVTQTSTADEACFAILEKDIEKIQQMVAHEFIHEFNKNFLSIEKNNEQAIIILIGEEVKQALDKLGSIFIGLHQNNIVLKGIVHGTSKCNLSYIVDSHKSLKALEIIHKAIFGVEQPNKVASEALTGSRNETKSMQDKKNAKLYK